MSIGFLVKPDQPLIWRGPMLHSAIRQFLTDVAWGELDYLVIDLPPGTGDAALSLAQSLPLSGGVIVTLPQQVSLDDARRGLEMFRQLDVPIFGVVENMSYLELPDGNRMDVFGTGGGERLAKEAGVPFIGAIPMDPAVRAGGDSGKPVVVTPPIRLWRALCAIAEDVAAKISVAAMQQNRADWWVFSNFCESDLGVSGLHTRDNISEILKEPDWLPNLEVMQPFIVGIRFQKVGKVYHFDASNCRRLAAWRFRRGRYLPRAAARRSRAVVQNPALPGWQLEADPPPGHPARPGLRQIWQKKEVEAMINCRAKLSELKIEGVKVIAAEFTFDGAACLSCTAPKGKARSICATCATPCSAFTRERGSRCARSARAMLPKSWAEWAPAAWKPLLLDVPDRIQPDLDQDGQRAGHFADPV
jgi:hypothetical protein